METVVFIRCNYFETFWPASLRGNVKSVKKICTREASELIGRVQPIVTLCVMSLAISTTIGIQLQSNETIDHWHFVCVLISLAWPMLF